MGFVPKLLRSVRACIPHYKFWGTLQNECMHAHSSGACKPLRECGHRKMLSCLQPLPICGDYLAATKSTIRSFTVLP